MFSSISYSHIIMQSISRTFLPCKTETLYSLKFLHFPLTIPAGNHHPTSYFYKFDSLRYLK
jgi:hypothetical protein